MKKGDQGIAVTNLQKNLVQLGYGIKIDGIYGNETENAVANFQEHHSLSPSGLADEAFFKKLTASLVAQISNDKSPWMDFLKKNLGQHEIAGSNNNPFIVSLFKHTSFKSDSDETPWCAACACAALEESGFASTGSASAASFVDFGVACDLKPGAIVVVKRADGGHHVTFCDHVIGHDLFIGIGGNQGNELKASPFKISSIVAVRWAVEPIKVAPIEPTVKKIVKAKQSKADKKTQQIEPNPESTDNAIKE